MERGTGRNDRNLCLRWVFTENVAMDRITIERRFNGPKTSGNGGWVAGSLARLLGGAAVSVSLRAPAPLDVPLSVRRREDGGVDLAHEETLIAQAAQEPLDLVVPGAPDFAEAEAAGRKARESNAQETDAPYAHCFGCGLAREDGLRIVPGLVGNEGMLATSWTPPSSVANSSGEVSVEATWTALDCSGGLAWTRQLGSSTAIVTARITGAVESTLRAGHPYIVIGWPIAQEGRKLHSGTATFDLNGKVQASSRQLWLIQRG
jgi:hypothetical protein